MGKVQSNKVKKVINSAGGGILAPSGDPIKQDLK